MGTPLFDSYLIVDWSARSVPGPVAPTKDSVWWTMARRDGTAVATGDPVYVRTRKEAVERLVATLKAETDANRRTLVSFDFPFGYPAGVARRLTGSDSALALWAWLADAIKDDAENRNNRFHVAEAINRAYDGTGPMWGRPATWDHPDLPVTARERTGTDHPPERRLADRRAVGAKTVWQLAYSGSVGSQVLLGLPALQRLRKDARIADATTVWPFETGLTAPASLVVLAEVYPSLIRAAVAAGKRDGEFLDAAQTRLLAGALAVLDGAGRLAQLFEGPKDVTPEDHKVIADEEAWILGVGWEALLAQAGRSVAPSHVVPMAEKREPVARAANALSYERDPAAIYRQSFAIVREEARLDYLPDDLHEVAIRLVHACGMTDVPNRLAWSADVAASARAALADGAPILCDCEMAASGIVRGRLAAGNAVVCTLNDPAVPALATQIGNTRSAAAVEFWRDHIAGAVVVIGNAPTALFHLLELLDTGWPRPAAILGFPVGFVGAAESKAELARNSRGVPFLTLRGRRGGSAMAAAALNGLAAGLEAPR